MLDWYYGLDDAEVLDYNQIAERLDLSHSQVSERLHSLLAHLLGSEVVQGSGDRGGTTPARCRVCRAIGRSGWSSLSGSTSAT